jgi:hypothetical protein
VRFELIGNYAIKTAQFIKVELSALKFFAPLPNAPYVAYYNVTLVVQGYMVAVKTSPADLTICSNVDGNNIAVI